MDVILIPGFWLDASSWNEVTPALEAAGHRVHPVTLPGLESAEAPRAGIGLADHIEAVVRLVDGLDGPVALVGHSGGGAVAQGVADRRPDRIARVVYVDAAPIGEGDCINDELHASGHDIPFPDWSVFEEADLADLDDGLRRRFRERAVPHPAAAASDPMRLGDERRLDVPTTIVCCEFSSETVAEWIAAGVPFVREVAAHRDVDYVDLPTGHWPQFTRPAELGRVLVDALPR
ncbi:alpha/beta fold hydrolase [Agromyces sp. ZXT2-6]|uniref:alpha/beta fold hydrolase n=1 Tax=Agromyces sp. ZXT2-6 TaxID=3461153 RepID=UPI0040550AF0